MFGEFRNDKRFRGVCQGCNHSFGRFEQQLSQASPLGFFRGVVGPNLGRRAGRGGLRQSGALGVPAPQHLMQRWGVSWLVRPLDDPRDAEPVDQIVILDDAGVEHQIRLFAGMSEERLREEIARCGMGRMKEVTLLCEPEDFAQFTTVIQKLCAECKVTEEQIIDSGDQRVPYRVEFRVTIAYFQAIAKIAFHYYLIHNRRGYTGGEAIFDGARDFIQNGGDPKALFRPPERHFFIPFGRGHAGYRIVPKDWCHLCAADESRDVIVVYLQFFLGPGSVPKPIYVALGSIPNPVAMPDSVWGHVFQYDASPEGRFAGQVDPVTITHHTA
jgi:hypothetical protein